MRCRRSGHETCYHMRGGVTCVALDPSVDDVYLRDYQKRWPHYVYAILPGGRCDDSNFKAHLPVKISMYII